MKNQNLPARGAKISLIAAIAEKNRAIGKDNKLLWHLPNDLQRFKKLTLGHPVIMGFKTFMSLGRPLPGRLNIVLLKEDLEIKGAIICHNIDEAIKVAKKNDDREIFFIGGGSVYEQAIKIVDKLYLTVVEGDYDADTFFPDYAKFKKVVYEKSEEANGYKYKYLELEK